MKLQTTRETLLTPLQKVLGAIEKRQTLPILSNVLIRLEGDRLELTGTDLEIQLVGAVQVEPGEDGATTVTARKLHDIINLLPKGADIRLEHRNDRLTLRCGSSRYQMSTMPVENYPAFDRGQASTHLALSADLLCQAIDATLYAMALQDVRYYLNGMLLMLDANELRVVASDGHRLATWAAALPEGLETPRQMILPRKAVQELSRLLKGHPEPIRFSLAENSLTVDLGALIFSTKLIEGRYPHWQRVMPGQLDRAYTVPKVEFEQALARAKTMTEHPLHSVAMSIQTDEVEATLKLTGASPDTEVEESLLIEVDGEPIEAGFNAQYLADALGPIAGDHVRLQFNQHAQSCLVDHPDEPAYQAVVMPMRL